MASHGVFITIDGTDGSGKATQTKLLVERLTREGRGVQTISFPQYGKKSAGLVEEYLSGTFGTALDVGPYASSIFSRWIDLMRARRLNVGWKQDRLS